MLFTEFNMEDALEVRGEEKFAEGRLEGMAEGRQKGMAEGRQKGMVEGRQKGMAEGRQKGMAEGRQKGIAEGRQKGIAEGQAASVLELLEDLGGVSAELKETILNQGNPETLKQWLKLAAKVNDLREFESKI